MNLSPLLGGVVPGLLHGGAGHPHCRGPGPRVPVWAAGGDCPLQLAATWAHSAASFLYLSVPPSPSPLQPPPMSASITPRLDRQGPRHTQPQASGSASRCVPQPSGLPGTSESCPLRPRGPPQDEPPLTFRPAASSTFAPERAALVAFHVTDEHPGGRVLARDTPASREPCPHSRQCLG